MERRLVLMTGYPASGKSTLAAALSQALGYPLISKDAMLAIVFEAMKFGPGEVAASMRCGDAAWALFWHFARTAPSAVLATTLRPTSEVERAHLAALAAPLVEVRCECPP